MHRMVPCPAQCGIDLHSVYLAGVVVVEGTYVTRVKLSGARGSTLHAPASNQEALPIHLVHPLAGVLGPIQVHDCVGTGVVDEVPPPAVILGLQMQQRPDGGVPRLHAPRDQPHAQPPVLREDMHVHGPGQREDGEEALCLDHAQELDADLLLVLVQCDKSDLSQELGEAFKQLKRYV